MPIYSFKLCLFNCILCGTIDAFLPLLSKYHPRTYCNLQHQINIPLVAYRFRAICFLSFPFGVAEESDLWAMIYVMFSGLLIFYIFLISWFPNCDVCNVLCPLSLLIRIFLISDSVISKLWHMQCSVSSLCFVTSLVSELRRDIFTPTHHHPYKIYDFW